MTAGRALRPVGRGPDGGTFACRGGCTIPAIDLICVGVFGTPYATPIERTSTMLSSSRLGRVARSGVLVAALALIVTACGGAGATVKVTEPWIRYTGPDVPAGGFMVLANSGSQDDALLSASSPHFTSIELHETVEGSDGMMAMQPVTSIPVPAGGTTELKPGSYHMMLFDPVDGLEVGQSVDITLTFERGGTVTIQAVVQVP